MTSLPDSADSLAVNERYATSKGDITWTARSQQSRNGELAMVCSRGLRLNEALAGQNKDSRLNMALLQGGGVSFGPNGVCWDCPLSFRDATQLVAVVVVCVAIGIWLRGTGQPRLRTIGSCLLGLAAIEIFVINHAGWNWGIIQAVDPRQYYSPYAVSAFASLLGAAAAGFVIYFDRRLQKKPKQTSSG